MEELLADHAPDRFSHDVAKAELAQMRDRIARLEPVYMASQAEGGTLHQAAMYAAPDREVRSYIAKVRSSPRNAKTSYFRMNGADGEIRLASDEVWHIGKRHPDFDARENIPKVMDEGSKTLIGRARATGGTEAFAYTLPIGNGKTHLVIAAPVAGKKGNHNRVLTSFIDSENAVRAWLERKNPYPDAGELENLLFQPGTLPGSGPDRNINRGGNGVNYQASIPRDNILSPNILGSALTDSKGRSVLRLFANHNQSTVIHEMSHAVRRQLEILAQGVGLIGTGNQLWNLGNKGVEGAQDIFDRFLGAPKVDTPMSNGETGGQAVQQATGPMTNGVQMNSGVQVGEQMSNNALPAAPDFVNGNSAATVPNTASALQGQMAGAEEQAGNLAAQSLKAQMYADPALADPGLLSQSAQTAGQIQVAGPDSVTSGLSGMAAPAIGGAVGGLAGKELGRAIGGDTGATVGSLAGSLGGAYLGGLAMSSLAGGVGGAASGAAAGAAAGSAVPGLGTFIGAGLGVLTSLFL